MSLLPEDAQGQQAAQLRVQGEDGDSVGPLQRLVYLLGQARAHGLRGRRARRRKTGSRLRLLRPGPELHVLATGPLEALIEVA